MRILWVKAGGLVPPDVGGRIRSFFTLRELARRHEVTTLLFYPAESNDIHRQTLTELGMKAELFPLVMPHGRSFAEMLRFAALQFHPLPYSIAKYRDRRVAERIRELLAPGRFDVAVCDFLTPGPMFPWRSGTPVVLFTHNLEAEIWKRQTELAKSPIWRYVYGQEAAKTERVEAEYLRQADLVLSVSPRDTAAFAREIPESKIRTIPTGVDTEYFRPDPARELPNRLVFTGSMDWLPNEDAMLYGAAEVLPRILAVRPDVDFYCVGRRPTAAVLALPQSNPRIHVTGTVPDIRPYLHEASVYIVPMRSGSGTRLKIFEAMAAGKAIVSTTVGAEGLPVQSGENIVLADDPADFAAAVLRLLASPEERRRLGAAARQLVEDNFGWPSVGRFFEDCLEEARTGAQTNSSSK